MAYTTEDTYVADGATKLYGITFPYLSEDDIKASLDGTDLPTTEYELANATTLEFVNTPAEHAAIRIYRVTDASELDSVFYAGSAIRARDLNDNFTQTLYIVQESSFNAGESVEAAEQAAQSAANAEASALQASDDATAASNNANAAGQDAAAAQQSANNASQSAADAVAEAAQATQTAVDAETKADEAIDAVAAVVPYEEVANVAAIPTSPDNNEGVKVVDSTGIENFSPLTGLPAGHVGDPGIFAKIIWSSASNTWLYDSYNANDPDDRYSGAIGGQDLQSVLTQGNTSTLSMFVDGVNAPSFVTDDSGDPARQWTVGSNTTWAAKVTDSNSSNVDGVIAGFQWDGAAQAESVTIGEAILNDDPYYNISTSTIKGAAPSVDQDAVSIELGSHNGSPGPNTNYDTNIYIYSDGKGKVTNTWDFCEGLNTGTNYDDVNYQNRTSILGSSIYILDKAPPYGHTIPTAHVIAYDQYDTNDVVIHSWFIGRQGNVRFTSYDLDSLPILP